MDEARSYAEWREAAIAHDKATGVHEWVVSDESKYFDYVSIRRRLEKLRKLRAAGDHERLLYALNEGVHGNIDGIGNNLSNRLVGNAGKNFLSGFFLFYTS